MLRPYGYWQCIYEWTSRGRAESHLSGLLPLVTRMLGLGLVGRPVGRGPDVRVIGVCSGYV